MQTFLRWTAGAAAWLVAGGGPLASAQTPTTGAPPAATAPAPNAAANAYLEAVRKGDAAAVEKALAGGVAVDTPFRYGRTALSFAADRGHVEVVRLLLAKGANPDTQDTYYNQTPLAWASQPAQARRPEHAEVVRLLLEKGAKGRDRALAAAIGADDVKMVQVILAAGSPPAPLLSELLAAARKNGKTAVATALEQAGATMPVVATLTAAQLARLPGAYNDGRNEITLAVKDGVVSGSLPNQSFVLSPRSETAFVIEGQPGMSVTFAYEGDRATTLTVVNQAGQTTVYKRVVQP